MRVENGYPVHRRMDSKSFSRLGKFFPRSDRCCLPGMSSVAKHLQTTRGPAGFFIGWSGMQVRQGLWTGGFFGTCDVFNGIAQGAFGKGLASDVCGRGGATFFAYHC